MYGCETWKMNEGDATKIDVFQNQCLRRIMKIKWQDKISNRELLERANVERLSEEVRRRRWRFFGHILRQQPDCVTALTWIPEGKRKRGRPKATWRRTVEKERCKAGWQSWREVRTAAQDRNRWRAHVEALCAKLAPGDKWSEVKTFISQKDYEWSSFRLFSASCYSFVMLAVGGCACWRMVLTDLPTVPSFFPLMTLLDKARSITQRVFNTTKDRQQCRFRKRLREKRGYFTYIFLLTKQPWSEFRRDSCERSSHQSYRQGWFSSQATKKVKACWILTSHMHTVTR